MPLVKDSSGLRLRVLKARMSRCGRKDFAWCFLVLTAIFIIISHTNDTNDFNTNDFNLRKMQGRCKTASY